MTLVILLIPIPARQKPPRIALEDRE
jgi:hypothetical protein